MEENVATRLKFFLDSEGLSNSQFADRCGIPRPTLSQLLSGRNKKISDVLVAQIHTAYPELSIMWLLFGEGTMLSIKRDSDRGSMSESEFGVDGDEYIAENNRQISEMRGIDNDNPEYSKENGVNRPFLGSESFANQRDSSAKKIAELEREIMRLKAKPRKVVQITVYYDDNTFETFHSGGN